VPSSATTPSPQPPIATFDWHKLGTIGATIRDVIGFAGGYASIGDDLRVWISRDARDWTAVKLPFAPGPDASGLLLEGGVNAIAASGSNLLIVGWQERGPCAAQPSGGDTTGGFSCPHEPIAWTSSDGRHWGVSTDTGTGVDPGEFISAWGVPGSGWDASLAYWEGTDLRLDGIWHSTDGASWTRLAEAADERIERADTAGAASATGRRVVTVFPRDFGSTSLYAAPGETTWSVDGLERASLVRAVLSPTTAGKPWLLVGSAGGSIPCVPAVWTSRDGSSWTETPLPWRSGSAVMSADRVAAAGGRYVVVGAATGGETADHETWVSDDAVHWTELSGVGAIGADYGPGLVAAGPVGFVGVSAAGQEGASDVWRLRADPRPGSTATPSPSPVPGWPTVTAGTVAAHGRGPAR
jgi:hypothetical protein